MHVRGLPVLHTIPESGKVVLFVDCNHKVEDGFKKNTR